MTEGNLSAVVLLHAELRHCFSEEGCKAQADADSVSSLAIFVSVLVDEDQVLLSGKHYLVVFSESSLAFCSSIVNMIM